jgi:hypothetical protein
VSTVIGMALTVEMITFDCSDPAMLGGWWAEHFGGTTQEVLADEFTAVTLSQGPGSGFRRCPIPRPEKTACTSTSVPPMSMPKYRG